jgi:hypothetical protein
MNTPTPTPRTDAAWTSSFEGKQLSAGQTARSLRDCSQQLERELTALTTERDQLRADCENETKWAAHYLAQSIADKARAERAEAELGKLQELHGCSQEMVVHWCEHAANRSLGLDQARSELATEREKSERYRLATLKLDSELATEGARLDWLESDAGVDWQWSSSALTIRRAVIDAAMKEDAK